MSETNTAAVSRAESRTAPRNPAELLRGRDMLCFSHDWSGDPLSKNQLMKLLARDNRVLWVNSIGYRTPRASAADMGRAWRKLRAAMAPLSEPVPNLHVLNPIAVPAWSPLIQRLNRRLLRWQVQRTMRRLGFRRPINWVFNPMAGVIAGHLGEAQVIYYCVDEFKQFPGVAYQAMADIEQQLLRRADLVIVSADRLVPARRQVNPHTVLVRHGVDYEHFRTALDATTAVPAEVAQLPRPLIGFFGLLTPDWVDMELLAQIAEHFRQGSLVLLGKETAELPRLRQLPNVHLLGRKPYAELPAYCKAFDVALLPFTINELTLNANPLKVREYLAAGLPVVSTALPEVEVLGCCHVARDSADFLRAIEMALAEPVSRSQRSAAMASEGWAARLDEIRSHLAAL